MEGASGLSAGGGSQSRRVLRPADGSRRPSGRMPRRFLPGATWRPAVPGWDHPQRTLCGADQFPGSGADRSGALARRPGGGFPGGKRSAAGLSRTALPHGAANATATTCWRATATPVVGVEHGRRSRATRAGRVWRIQSSARHRVAKSRRWQDGAARSIERLPDDRHCFRCCGMTVSIPTSICRKPAFRSTGNACCRRPSSGRRIMARAVRR
jgi:hypothetical protein